MRHAKLKLFAALFALAGISTKSIAQDTNNVNPAANKQVISDKHVQDSIITAWMHDLYEEPVTVGEDSLVMSKDALRLLTDESYRKLMFPKTYTWETVAEFIKVQQLKKAFWYMINLYMADDKNKDIVIKSFLSYEKFLKMDKVVLNSFYTYVLADPEIGSFVNGQFKVTAPHIMEKKLNAVRQILFNMDKYKNYGKKESK